MIPSGAIVMFFLLFCQHNNSILHYSRRDIAPLLDEIQNWFPPSLNFILLSQCTESMLQWLSTTRWRLSRCAHWKCHWKQQMQFVYWKWRMLSRSLAKRIRKMKMKSSRAPGKIESGVRERRRRNRQKLSFPHFSRENTFKEISARRWVLHSPWDEDDKGMRDLW